MSSTLTVSNARRSGPEQSFEYEPDVGSSRAALAISFFKPAAHLAEQTLRRGDLGIGGRFATQAQRLAAPEADLRTQFGADRRRLVIVRDAGEDLERLLRP